jgi:type III pantothenate kinase
MVRSATVLLAVDIGNTNIVFGLYSGRELVQTFRFATVHTRTADEYGVLLHQLLSLRTADPRKVDASIMASVVPPLTDVMSEAIRHAVGQVPLVVGPGTKTGISIVYDHPRDVGADRIVNAVAAFERFKSGAIIVDFGTATTFDCVSPKAEYLGGVIVPGVRVSLDALLGKAAKLSRIEIAEPPQVVGQNTTHALQSGIVYGYASLVDGLVRKLKAELGFPCHVLATGGLAPLIVKHCEMVEGIDDHLTLEGLRILHERNGKAEAQRGRAAQ